MNKQMHFFIHLFNNLLLYDQISFFKMYEQCFSLCILLKLHIYVISKLKLFDIIKIANFFYLKLSVTHFMF
jgi:hypothetical protein